jgi:hypothetical protein
VNELSLVCSIEAGLAIAWHNCSAAAAASSSVA